MKTIEQHRNALFGSYIFVLVFSILYSLAVYTITDVAYAIKLFLTMVIGNYLIWQGRAIFRWWHDIMEQRKRCEWEESMERSMRLGNEAVYYYGEHPNKDVFIDHFLSLAESRRMEGVRLGYLTKHPN